MVDRVSVGILGATGLVGQRFIQLLHEHPWFEITKLAGSSEKAGKKYSEAVLWIWDRDPPESVADMRLCYPRVEEFSNLDIVFSALPSSIAMSLEPELAKSGTTIVSTNSFLRMKEDIPLINPEVNADHIEIIEVQRTKRKWKGCILKAPNCTTAILTLTLKPLLDSYGIKSVRVATMQAVSGAGYRGVLSLDILDNIIPYIEGEEEKVTLETRKILGRLENKTIVPLEIQVSASCHRVPVIEGHLEAVFVELIEAPSSIDEVIRILKDFKGIPQELRLPTAPPQPIIFREEKDRPQPRLDRMAYRGMAVTVGRVRKDDGFDKGIKYVVLGSNTVRGAAGAALLTAELLYALEKI